MGNKTRAKWEGGHLTFFDSRQSFETVKKLAPLQFSVDFNHAWTAVPAAGAPESGCLWVKKIVNTLGTPTVAAAASAGGGAIACALDATAEEQEALLYMNDNRQFSLAQGLVFETRINLAVLPTLNAEIVWGLCGDYALGPDTVVYSVFFSADGSGLVYCEKDDGAGGSDQSVTSGITLVNTDWKVFRIDARDVTSIKFFIDGTRVASTTTFPYIATGANATLQPYFGCYKDVTDAGLGTINIDYVRIWQNRS
jgi:hypothetical protein